MTGFMNIRITVAGQQALREISRVEGQLSRLAIAQAAAGSGASRHSTATQRSLKSLTSFGNQLQWTGRQLQYNWTLPILAAAAAGAHFQLENERAMTRVAKVYGDASMDAAILKNELKALEGAFEALSERYGIVQAETIGIAAEWAAAGSSGLALAKQTELTMKTMVLGELEAAEATEALVAIQAQYNMSSDELADTIARLNNVENQTGTTMGDLIMSFSRAAGVARAAGIDVAHLAAMTAALTPAAGSASQAGNALKTIISRLLSPTGEASQILNEMGIHVDEMAWKSANAATRIELLSKKYEGLSDSQKAVVSATLASRYQINKFEVLMDAIARKGDAAGNGMSYYWKALEAATNRTEYLAQVTKELNTVLDSNPKKWDRIKVIMQNAMANVVQPMLPALMGLGMFIANVTRRLSELSPETQKWIGVLLLSLVVLPLATRYLGSLVTLFGVFSRLLFVVGKPLIWLTGVMWGFISTMVITPLMFTLRTAALAVGAAFQMMGILIMAATRWMVVIPALLNLVISASIFAASMIATPLVGIWAAVRASWMIGLSSLASLALAAFAMIGAAVPATLGATMATTFAPVLALWSSFTGAMAVVWAALGPILSSIWIAISVSLAVVMAETGKYLTLIWAGMTAAFEAILIAFATTAGIIWRAIPLTMAAGLRGPWAIILSLTSALMVGMQTIFAAGWAAIQSIIVAGAAATGLVWRTMMVGLVTVTTVGGAALAGAWRLITFTITQIVTVWGPMMVTLMRTIGAALVAALASPWTWLAIAVIAVLYGLRDKISKLWTNMVEWLGNATDAVSDRVVGAFNRLPEGVRNAILAVVRIVRAAVMKVYELFSYLNPFARHSPSLVENVTRGMAEVNRQFGTITRIKGPIDAAYASIARFKTAMGAIGDIEFAKDRELIAEINPAALASFDNLTRTLIGVRARADQLNAAVKQQERVVGVWKNRLDVANESLDDQKSLLQKLQDVADSYKDRINELSGEISTLASTPLVGMGAMEDALFANELAQKRLRLEMLKAGEEGGQSYEEIRNKISLLAGEMETLTGTREDLRSMGAGSEILDHYDAQIEALADQKKALEQAEAPINEMQQALDRLQREAEIMDLEKALKFDPLTRAIDKAANAMDEMPFDAIISKIRSNQAAIDQLEPAYDAATAAVRAQEAAVASAQATVDSIQASYDAEAQKLEVLRDLYGEVADAVRDMESALSDASGAANAMKGARDASEYVSPALQNFRDAAGGDFADVGGSGIIGRENPEILDQSALIDDFTKQIQDELGNAFGGFDMFAPIKDMWNKFVGWWRSNVVPYWDATKQFFGDVFDGVDIFPDLSDEASKVGDAVRSWWDTIVNVATGLFDFGKIIWDLLGPELTETLELLWGFLKDMWERLKGVFSDIGDIFGPFMQALSNLWNFLEPIFMAIGALILFAVKIIWGAFNGVLGPVLEWIGNMFSNLWDIIYGIFQVIVGLFTGDWQMLWDGVVNIVDGIWDSIYDTISGVLKAIWGLVGGTLSAIGDIFIWLWDLAIKPVVDWIWDALQWVGDKFVWLWDHSVGWAISKIADAWSALASGFVWVWDSILSPVLSVIGDVFKVLLYIVTVLVLGPLVLAWQALAWAFSWAWDNILQPVIEAFAKAGQWLWDTILKPVFDAIGGAWDGLIRGMAWVWDSVLKPAWEAIEKAMAWLWDSVLKPIWEKMVEFWDRMIRGFVRIWETILKPAWDAIQAAASWLWETVLKPIWEKMAAAWDLMIRGMTWVWETVLKPAWDAIKSAAEGVASWVSEKFTWLRDTVTGIFQAIKDKVGEIWDGLLEKVKTPIKVVFDFVNTKMIDPINSLLSKFPGDLEIGHLPTLREGGLLHGPGTGTSDSILGVNAKGVPTSLVSNGEFVVNQKSTRANFGLINAINSAHGKLPGFEGGGLLGAIGGAAGWAWDKATDGAAWVGNKLGDLIAKGGRYAAEHILKPLRDMAKGMIPGDGIFPTMLRGSIDKLYNAVVGKGDEHDRENTLTNGTFTSSRSTPNGIGGLGPMAQAARAWVMQTYGLNNIGGYAYRNIAGTGSLSDHALGKAIDVMIPNYKSPMGISRGNRVANHFVTNPAQFGTKYVIWRDQINQGRGWEAYGHPGGGRSDTLQHRDHVHISLFDQGGILNGLGVNLTGRPERVLSPRQTLSFDRLVTILDRNGIPSMERMEAAIFRASAKANALNAIGQQTIIQHQGDNNVTININGDLSFPNITNGDDADVFLQNLGDLAGGGRR